MTPRPSPPARRPPIAARLRLLGLYPAEYRAAYGGEIGDVFAHSVQGLGNTAALREWASLAAHALRLRTRLSSSDPAGRIAAGAAPFILAGGAGLSMVHLLLGLFLPDPLEFEDWGHPAFRTTLVAVQTLPWILALICACQGRWAPTRLLVALGMLGRIGVAVAFLPHAGPAFTPYLMVLPFFLAPGTLLLIAPPDAVDLSPLGRGEIVLAALALALPMSALVVLWPQPDPGGTTAPVFPPAVQTLTHASAAWPAAVMSFAMLRHLRARRPDPLRATGIAAAVLPWTAMLAPPYYWLPPRNAHDLLRNAAIVLALLALAVLLARLRRTRPAPPQNCP
ncbi:hypothetical protein ABT187_45860 [Streptomyces sp. NPDC001817]|uniref:hypothetical protein n=1 Tax=Streptomyces sp. NPDC001817 TaxID=3154398 RepID=UPI0033344295